MRITLPVQLNPISRRKDRSVKLSFETRELAPEEIITLMALEGSEAWIALVPYEEKIDEAETPDTRPDIGMKTPSERLRSVMFVWYKSQVEENKFIGTFDSFYSQKMEAIIESIKSKIDDKK